MGRFRIYPLYNKENASKNMVWSMKYNAKDEIKAYTSFDYLYRVTKNKGNIFLYSVKTLDNAIINMGPKTTGVRDINEVSQWISYYS